MTPSTRRLLSIGLQYAFAALLAVVGYLVVTHEGPGWLAALSEEGLVVERPDMLWALLIIPVLIAVRAHTLSDLPRIQQGLSILLKAAFIALLTLSLIDIQKRDFAPKRAAIVYAVDVSDSMPDAALALARDQVETLWHAALSQPADTRPEVRVVTFANDAREVLLPEVKPGEKPALPAFMRMPSKGAPATDVQGALRLALTLLPDGLLPRVVLVSDGLETMGSVAAESDPLAAFGVPIHHLDLGRVERPSELMVIGLEIPDQIVAKVPFTATARVRTNAAMKARCEVQIGGLVEKTEEKDLAVGDTTLTWELTVKEGGDKKILTTCTPLDTTRDRFATNNRFELPFKVPERPRVLYIEGERGLQKNLAAALQADFDVELRGERGVPNSIAEAEQFDLIFVSDVARTSELGGENLSNGQQRVLEQYAKKGGGLIFAGGENSFGPGGWGQTLLEREVLPVRLDVQRKQDTPNLALMLVIDRSGSMAGPKIELAKQGAIATLGALQPDDLLGICAFDSRPGELVSLQRAANRFKITEAISRLRSGGGTNIFAALDYAYNELAKVEAKIKHIIVLTDGQSPRAGVIELASQAALERITISSIAVGTGSDEALLRDIAETAGGNYYLTISPQSIPKLLLKETSEVTRKALVEDKFRPRTDPRFKNLQIFRGLNMDAVPPLVGYVSTRPKPRAEVLMTSHLGEPILARWRLGLGKVVVWTSDVKNRWAHYWLSWPGYAKLFRQLVRDTLRSETEDPSYAMVADIEGTTLTVGVDAVDEEDRFIDGVTSEVTAIAPDGRELPITLSQVAAGRYEGKLELETYGPYVIKGRHTPKRVGTDAPPTYRSFATIAWPFPDEHLLGDPDLSIFERLAALTGGSKNPEAKTLFEVGDAKTESRTPMWPEPLPWALGLLIADVLLRRVRLYGKTEIRWL